MTAVIMAFGVMGAGFMCFLPFYWLPVLCVALGYMLRMTWKQTFQFALISAALSVAGAFYLDFINQNLISKKIGNVLQVPPAFVPFLPGVVMAYIGIFFSQLGSSARVILKK